MVGRLALDLRYTLRLSFSGQGDGSTGITAVGFHAQFPDADVGWAEEQAEGHGVAGTFGKLLGFSNVGSGVARRTSTVAGVGGCQEQHAEQFSSTGFGGVGGQAVGGTAGHGAGVAVDAAG